MPCKASVSLRRDPDMIRTLFWSGSESPGVQHPWVKTSTDIGSRGGYLYFSFVCILCVLLFVHVA